MGPGENAGAVDVGAGHAVAFKVESHNHPSAVEPFQGAATGVGGILRDVFALGARPIAVLDSLRFGELDVRALPLPARSGGRRNRPLRELDRGADRRAARSTSRPPTSTTASSTRCAWGWRRADRMVRSAAAGVGQRRGAAGRIDGARRDRRRLGAGLGRARRGRREAAQRADRRPVRGEEADGVLPGAARSRACWWRFRTSAPPASPPPPPRWRPPAGSGSTSHVDRVPLREADMEPFEIMISESQERMLAVVEPASDRRRHGGLRAVADRGRGDRRGHRHRPDPGHRRTGEAVADVPVSALIDGCPLYDLEPEQPDEWLYGNQVSLDPDAEPNGTLPPCSPRRASPRSAGRSSSTTRSSNRGRCAARGPPTPRC